MTGWFGARKNSEPLKLTALIFMQILEVYSVQAPGRQGPFLEVGDWMGRVCNIWDAVPSNSFKMPYFVGFLVPFVSSFAGTRRGIRSLAAPRRSLVERDSLDPLAAKVSEEEAEEEAEEADGSASTSELYHWPHVGPSKMRIRHLFVAWRLLIINISGRSTPLIIYSSLDHGQSRCQAEVAADEDVQAAAAPWATYNMDIDMHWICLSQQDQFATLRYAYSTWCWIIRRRSALTCLDQKYVAVFWTWAPGEGRK